MKYASRQKQRQATLGFTLIEIAVVMVIVGLLIGAILRGQELINSARERSMINQQMAIQAAYYGFIDRYKTMPGTLTAANRAMVGNLAVAASVTTGVIGPADSPVVFNNLAAAGFINCAQCLTFASTLSNNQNVATTVPSSANSPTNPYGQPLVFYYDPSIGSVATGAPLSTYLGVAGEAPRAMLTTGAKVPSSILASMDRKMDDGAPQFGSFRVTDQAGVLPANAVTGCWSAAAGWVVDPVGSCIGASLF